METSGEYPAGMGPGDARVRIFVSSEPLVGRGPNFGIGSADVFNTATEPPTALMLGTDET